MSTPNVFRHMDGTFSAPFCKLGENMIYMWFNRKQVYYTDVMQTCGKPGCTCSNESTLSNKATDQGKKDFYFTLHQLSSTI